MDDGLLRLCRGIIRCGSLLVPAAGRRDWRDEWTAELAHAWPRTRGVPVSVRLGLVRRCLGAIPDGASLFASEWLPALHADAMATALRDLGRTPVQFSMVVLALALLLGIVAGSYSAARTLVRPRFPFPDADRIVRVEHGQALPGTMVRPFSQGELDSIRRCVPLLDRVSASRLRAERLESAHGASIVAVASVSQEYFDLLPVDPRIGRGLTPGDFALGAEPVIVLSQEMWRSDFRCASDVLGASVGVGGAPRRIVGVMPAEFAIDAGTLAWIPLPATTDACAPATSRDLELLAHLRDDSAPAEARAQITQALAEEEPACASSTMLAGIAVRPVAPPITERVPPALAVVLGLTPLLAVVPIASGAALIGRTSHRRRLSRAVALTGLAVALGAPLGGVVLSAFERALPGSSAGAPFRLDGPSIAGIVAAMIALLLRFAGSRTPIATRPWRMFACAVAVPVVLACGTVLRSQRELVRHGLGIDDRGLYTLGVHLGADATPADAARLERAALTVPGIEQVSLTSGSLFQGVQRSVSVRVAPGTAAADDRPSPPIETSLRAVDDDFARVLGVPLLGSCVVSRGGVVINRTAASRLGLEIDDALGRKLFVLLDDWVEMPVVGVVADVPQRATQREAQPEAWIGFDRTPRTEPNAGWITLLVRPSAASNPETLLPELRAALETNAGVSTSPERSLTRARERAAQRPRATMALAGLGIVFGVALLAIAGVPLTARRKQRRQGAGEPARSARGIL